MARKTQIKSKEILILSECPRKSPKPPKPITPKDIKENERRT